MREGIPVKRLTPKSYVKNFLDASESHKTSELTCPFELTSGSFLIGRRHNLVIPRNHLECEGFQGGLLDFWNGGAHMKQFSQIPQKSDHFLKDPKYSAVLFLPPEIFRLVISFGDIEISDPK